MKSQHQFPFMSVVVCVYNGGSVVHRAIESLLAQDYPKDRYEIIVVDDGSSDNTFEVVSRYPVRVVRHERNQGLAAARVTGLAHIRGDVYVGFDDDCIVDPGWLRALATGYQHPDALGVGGRIVPPAQVGGLVDRFMIATGSGGPPSLRQEIHNPVHKRFLAYIADQLRIGQTNPTEPYPVRMLYGASATFPVDVLRAVGGWDSSLRWLEDTDLANRINQAFPGRYFYLVPTALMVHDPKMSLRAFVKRPYTRGLYNVQFYSRNKVVPPIYPFPFAWVGGSILAGLIGGPLWLAVGLVVLPHVLYVWWPIRLVLERNLWCLVFPYLQLAEELSTVAGLVRGYALTNWARR